MTHTICFEQPLNEIMRFCLRLEHAYHLLECQFTEQYNSREAIIALCEICHMLERPDLRVKLTKELNRQYENLSKLVQTPGIDTNRLHSTLEMFKYQLDVLHRDNGRFANELRNNEFLHQIKQYQKNPGGLCQFDVPAFQLWCSYPVNQQQMMLQQWLSEIKDIISVTQFLLEVTRQSCSTKKVTAEDSHYQDSLDSNAALQLVQVYLSADYQAYPEVSVGRHGISIHFKRPDFQSRAVQNRDNIEFELRTCKT